MSNRWNGEASYYRTANTPNPADSGWVYQGANNHSRVEYWVKDDVKMDYYPTTGTVKTSMDHPSKGKTQLFRRDLDDYEFTKVAQKPRAHTGKGYYYKSQYKGY